MGEGEVRSRGDSDGDDQGAVLSVSFQELRHNCKWKRSWTNVMDSLIDLVLHAVHH